MPPLEDFSFPVDEFGMANFQAAIPVQDNSQVPRSMENNDTQEITAANPNAASHVPSPGISSSSTEHSPPSSGLYVCDRCRNKSFAKKHQYT